MITAALLLFTASIQGASFNANFDMYGDYNQYLYSTTNAQVYTEGLNSARYWAPTQVGVEGDIIYHFRTDFIIQNASFYATSLANTFADASAETYLDVSPDLTNWTTVGSGYLHPPLSSIDITSYVAGGQDIYIRSRLYSQNLVIAPQFLRTNPPDPLLNTPNVFNLSATGTPLPTNIEYFAQWKVEDGGNGHYYALVFPSDPNNNYTWEAANQAASQMTYNGLPGHLATVTSAEENAFLQSSFESKFIPTPYDGGPGDIAYIGLHKVNGEWQWVTGEPFSYSNWHPGDPKADPNPYDSVMYWTWFAGWKWNDNEGFALPVYRDRHSGFIVEFQAVPEASSTLMLAFGSICFGGFLAMKRRFRQS